MPLTDTAIRNLKPSPTAKKYSDGGGLHLFVTPQGSKLWRVAYRFLGKQKTLALGAYPVVSLAEARERRALAKKHLANGVDPSQHARVEKATRRDAHAATFNAIADEFLQKSEREGKAENTIAKKRWILGFARSALGTRPISEIKAAEILSVCRKVEAAGNYETALRLRATIGQVFRHAVATTRAEYDPTTNLRGALTAPPVNHYPAITDKKAFGGLLRAVDGYEGRAPVVRTALLLMAHLYPRPGELRFAEWLEFDLDKAVWTIPAKRTKTRREHRKPLSPQVVGILRAQQAVTTGAGLVLPGVVAPRRPLSENTFNATLRRLGFAQEEATSHGFRATASSLLNESGMWSPDAIEAELAHMGADEVRRAYHRAQYWDERVRMAAWWSDEIDRMRLHPDT